MYVIETYPANGVVVLEIVATTALQKEDNKHNKQQAHKEANDNAGNHAAGDTATVCSTGIGDAGGNNRRGSGVGDGPEGAPTHADGQHVVVCREQDKLCNLEVCQDRLGNDCKN
jgi:hypothetical protein